MRMTERWWAIHDDAIREALASVETGQRTAEQAYAVLCENSSSETVQPRDPQIEGFGTERADAILQVLQDTLLLRDWKPWIDHASPAPDGVTAQVFRRDDYFDARIRVSPRIADMSDWHIAQTLAHELMHLVVRDLHQAHERLVYSDHVPKAIRDDLLAAWAHEEEKLVDQMGRVLANLIVTSDEPNDHFPGFREEDQDNDD